MDSSDLIALLAISEPRKLLVPLLLEGMVARLGRPQLQEKHNRNDDTSVSLKSTGGVSNPPATVLIASSQTHKFAARSHAMVINPVPISCARQQLGDWPAEAKLIKKTTH